MYSKLTLDNIMITIVIICILLVVAMCVHTFRYAKRKSDEAKKAFGRNKKIQSPSTADVIALYRARSDKEIEENYNRNVRVRRAAKRASKLTSGDSNV